MDFYFEPDALAAVDQLWDIDPDAYDRIFDTLEAIAADPAEAKIRLGKYVSTRDVWGTHVRRTDYTVYWKTNERGVLVVYLIRE